MAACGTCVPRLYKGVIEEVIAGVRENFLDEGIDEQVLADLKQQWEAKLAATKAADQSDVNHTNPTQTQQSSAGNTSQQQQQQQQQQNNQQAPAAASSVQNMALVPVQITVPSQQAGGGSKTITIHVPSAALSSNIAGPQLSQILSSPAAAQTFALDVAQATEIIQRQLNNALIQNGVVLPPQLMAFNNPQTTQVDGPIDAPLGDDAAAIDLSRKLASVRPKKMKTKKVRSVKSLVASKTLSESLGKKDEESNVKVTAPTTMLDDILRQRLESHQVDGACGLDDSSDEISDDDDDDDEEEDKDDEKKGKEDEDDEEEETEEWNDDPLNSDDDVSDNETGDVFETDNVVVCQYDKITRVRNKWKFHLKDGIMNLKTKDYIFTKANGEGEW